MTDPNYDKVIEFTDVYITALKEALVLAERKLEVAVAALKLVDKSWFDPKEGEFACLACDMNQGNINDHDSWCLLQKAHDALKEIEGMK